MKILGELSSAVVESSGSVVFKGYPPLSTGSVGQGVIYFDTPSGKLLGSQNGQPAEEIIGGGGINILSYIGL